MISMIAERRHPELLKNGKAASGITSIGQLKARNFANQKEAPVIAGPR